MSFWKYFTGIRNVVDFFLKKWLLPAIPYNFTQDRLLWAGLGVVWFWILG